MITFFSFLVIYSIVISLYMNRRKNPKNLALCIDKKALQIKNCKTQLFHSGPYMHGPICILPNLYLGAHCNAVNKDHLARHSITHIINVASEVHIAPGLFEYHHLHWTHYQRNLAQVEFIKAIKIIEDALQRNQVVLVHCQQGVERSAALVLAYLIYLSRKSMAPECAVTTKNWSLDHALRYVQEKVPDIHPNMELLYQLREFERSLTIKPPNSHRQYLYRSHSESTLYH